MDKKTAFVIGTGPSLRDIDVQKLKDYDTISFNRSYISYKDEWGFDPTYYMCIDSSDLDSNLIENSDIKVFFLCAGFATTLLRRIVEVPENIRIAKEKDIKPSQNVILLYDFEDFIGGDALAHALHSIMVYEVVAEAHKDKGYGGEILGARVLCWLGYDEIVLVGCDARYRDDEESNKYIVTNETGKIYTSTKNYDVNHYREDYFGEGTSFGKPNEEEQLKFWRLMKEATASGTAKDINIYSCSKGSNLNKYFKYIDFEDFLAGKR
jgi:hypothetical protein